MNEETIFATARQWKEGPERRAFLDQACAGDPRLRAQVEQLLKADMQAGSMFEQPAGMPSATDIQDDPSARSNLNAEEIESLSFLSPCDNPGRLGKLGAYEILELIGRGGMGIVLRGLDLKLNRIVAIKALVPEFAANAMSRKRFLREAQAAAAVSHDHVVTIHAVEDEAKVPYLVMECIIGQSLQQKIDRQGALQVTEILRIGMQIALGLTAAHKQGLIHRDIKPANILLENGVERVKITDFGLARAVDDVGITQSGVIAGTPQYMSPEQAMGEPLDQRSDLFSLGSVLYTMCTGRAAFRADSTIAVIRRVCDDAPRPIRELNPEIPEWLVEVVERLLAKNPNDRYQTAAEVANVLEQYLAQIQQLGMSSGHRMLVNRARVSKAGKPVKMADWMLLPVFIAIMVGLILFVGLRNFRFRVRPTAQTTPQVMAPHVAPITRPNSPPEEQSPPGPPLAMAPFSAEQAAAHQTNWAKHLGVPVEFTNRLGMKFRLIPPGEFRMGSTPEELAELAKDLEQIGASAFDKFSASSSAPRHLVRLTQPYYIGQYEVTAAQYQQFAEATRHTLEKPPEAKMFWRDFVTEGQADKQPVVGLSWNDAQAFCRWLSTRDRLTYDLPTEAQWEYACRAGTQTLWTSGDDVSKLESQAIYGLSGTPAPALIGLKAANPFGVYDMHGNANEWCLDWHVRDFYARSPLEEPACLDQPGDPASGRVSRGGSWNAEAWWSRSAVRSYDFPAAPANPKGFRVVIRGRLTPPEQPAEVPANPQ